MNAPLSRLLLAILAALLLTALAYFPGLFGGFVLDDYANLQKLPAPNAGWGEFWHFIFAGYSGPIGRPVPMATFALQAASWPNSPLAFKVVNLGIHLLNGVLVFTLLRRMMHELARSSASRTSYIALAATVIWLLHPIHVSGVSYVVQRMNLLAATFALLGMLAYLAARSAARRRQSARVIALAFIGLPVAGLLALGSKENAVSLLFITATIEFLFVSQIDTRVWKWWRRLYLVAPLLILLTVIIVFWNSLTAGYDLKSFSLAERLMSEPRVLFSYMATLLVPSGPDIGLLHDDFAVSRGLFDPVTTLPSLLGLTALVAAVVALRKRAPLITAGLAWFLAGHLLEASVFPIELYFEHRNYLPSVGFFLAIVVLAAHVGGHITDKRVRQLCLLAAALYVSGLGWLTLNENLLWGDPVRQAFVWYEENPDSPRAQVLKGSMLRNLGRDDDMLEHFKEIAQHSDAPAAIYFTWLEEVCDNPDLPLPPREPLITALQREASSIGPTNVVENILGQKAEKNCEAVPLNVLRDILFTLSTLPQFNTQLPMIRSQQARLANLYGDRDAAIRLMRESDKQEPEIDKSLIISLWAVYNGDCVLADKYLQTSAQRISSIPAIGRLMYEQRFDFIDGLREELEQSESCQEQSQ